MTEKYHGDNGETWDNLWPDEKIPDLQPTYMSLGFFMRNTALRLASKIDAYIRLQTPTYEKDQVYSMLKDSLKITGRLLYYYNPNPSTSQSRNNAINS